MILINPDFPEASEQWFDPGYWGKNAEAVQSGGRGAAWFIRSSLGAFVLRHYRRGGLIARLSERYYFYSGARRTRAFAEYRLLRELHRIGLPVPRPVAAQYRRVGICYTAGIIVERIDHCTAFGSCWRDCALATWVQVGQTISRFHDAGVFHADLNAFNVLLGQNAAYLIDFDKCQRMPGALDEKRRRANLKRLHRSLKRSVSGSDDEKKLARMWPSLERGYDAGPV